MDLCTEPVGYFMEQSRLKTEGQCDQFGTIIAFISIGRMIPSLRQMNVINQLFIHVQSNTRTQVKLKDKGRIRMKRCYIKGRPIVLRDGGCLWERLRIVHQPMRIKIGGMEPIISRIERGHKISPQCCGWTQSIV